MINEDVIEMAKELRGILGSVNGATNVEENFALQYVVTVSKEEDKENVEKVAQMLTDQAEKKHLTLEIMVATQEEIDDARKRIEAMMTDGV